jgi:predicted alpha/beta hydrolase
VPRDGTWLMQRTTVAAADGYALTAHSFGDAQAARAAVLIVPAMGVEQTYYAPFAQWLAERAYFVVTFDYRGIGQSRRGRLRALAGDVITWAEQDVAAMLAFAEHAAARRPLLWIGHSLGGQIPGLVPGYERVRAMLTVAAGSGWWRDYPSRLRFLAPLLWYGIVPAALAVAGYFPGRRLGVIGDIPAGVMRQWRQWCLNPDYLIGALGPAVRRRYALLQLPILSLSFADDEYMSQRNIEALHAFYAGAPCEVRRITPAQIGVPTIGHFGFFRKRFEHSLWPQAADWLQQQTTTLH